MTPHRISFVLLPVLAVVAVACSREPQRFDDLSSLAEAVSSAGVACDRIDAGPPAKLVSETGTCGTSGVALYLFDRAGDLDDWKKVGTSVGPAVIGSNWAATGNADDLRQLAKALGGELVGGNA